MRKTSKKLQENPTPETGTAITYNIQDLKLHPERQQKHMELKQKHYTYNTHTHKNNPTKLERNGTTNTKCTYTNIVTQGKTQQERDNDWAKRQEQWSNAQERETMEYNLRKRQSLRKRTEQLKRTQGEIKKIAQQKFLHAWQQRTKTTTKHTKENRHNNNQTQGKKGKRTTKHQPFRKMETPDDTKNQHRRKTEKRKQHKKQHNKKQQRKGQETNK